MSRRKIPAIGRADLVALGLDLPAAITGRARWLNFAVREDLGGQQNPDPAHLLPWDESQEPQPREFEPRLELKPLQPVSFWYATAYQPRLGLAEPLPQARPALSAAPTWQQRPTEPPEFLPLISRTELQQRLQALLAPPTVSNRLDSGRAVAALARARPLHPLPRQQRPRFAPTVQVVVDRSTRLTPFWRDQRLVFHAIPALTHCQIIPWLFEEAPGTLRRLDKAPGDMPVPAAGPLLVLGDLGGLGGPTSLWHHLGGVFTQAGQLATALLPLPPEDLPPPMAERWRVAGWEVMPPAQQREKLAEDLLVLAAYAVRLEPGLLRLLRRKLLPQADAMVESLAWQHPALSSRASDAASFDTSHAAELRQRFAALPDSQARQALQCVRAWRQPLPDEIWFEEALSVPADKQHVWIPPDDLANATAFFEQLRRDGVDGTSPDGTLAWLARAGRRAPQGDGLWQHQAAAQAMALALCDDPTFAPPISPVAKPEGPIAQQIAIFQGQNGLSLNGGGSPLALLPSDDGHVEAVVMHAPPPPFWKSGTAPPWASAWGWDEFGAWARFTRAGISQRLRWISPGRFLMGSPEDEKGRYNREGPQHAVMLSRGFWLFDTPCTQALWLAVMGENPSRFKAPDRPVEKVSWYDAQKFIDRLNRQIPGLDLTLPTEAQWEYACRAGTQTALYTGRISIDKNSRAPALDAIAWYLNNSGGETHPVGQKAPNGWGLYDMLGNVREWCVDGRRTYQEKSETDPLGPAEPGAPRVLRGGSWHNTARDVRAAYSFDFVPDVRFDFIGFRCALGQASEPVGAEPLSPGPPRLAERRGAQGITGAAGAGQPLVLSSATADHPPVRAKVGPHRGIDLPPPPAPFILRSDRAELTIGQRHLSAIPWAEAIGRDRFGLWSRFRLGRVAQRLRWIPPGRFLMGSPEDEPWRYIDEGPQHQVTISQGFWLFDTPCTQALWQAVMGKNPSAFQSPDRPVERVTWNDAQKFIDRLNHQKKGLGLTLPTEAQWEYACRAGTQTALYTGPISIDKNSQAPELDAIAWYSGNSGRETHPVGQRAPNGWGLYDMLGNVWEWCVDGHRTYQKKSETDPLGPAKLGADRVLRGGSCSNDAPGVRAARRVHHPHLRLGSIGFRCALGQASEQGEAERSGKSKPPQGG